MTKDFAQAFSKTGIKHDTVALIFSFKQTLSETVRECSNRLKQYIARCPVGEVPTQERLVSLFLEGLVNQNLHATLFAKEHTNLNSCINDAIRLDDNCDVYQDGAIVANRDNKSQSGDSTSTVIITRNQNQPGQPRQQTDIAWELADEIIRRLSVTPNPPPVRTEPLRQPQHHGERPPQPPPRPWKWCSIENKWTNHEAHECYFRPRNEGNMQRMQAPMQGLP